MLFWKSCSLVRALTQIIRNAPSQLQNWATLDIIRNLYTLVKYSFPLKGFCENKNLKNSKFDAVDNTQFR